MVGILSQCIHILNHYVINFKYITILSVKYTLTELEEDLKLWNQFNTSLHSGPSCVLEPGVNSSTYTGFLIYKTGIANISISEDCFAHEMKEFT